jgi:hypothetical protein
VLRVTPALQLSRDLDCQYKTAFVLAHKLREAMGSEVHNPDLPELSGTVEIDGMYAGGNVKQANRKAERIDRRTAEAQTGKRQVVVVAREILGRTLPFVVPRESAGSTRPIRLSYSFSRAVPERFAAGRKSAASCDRSKIRTTGGSISGKSRCRAHTFEVRVITRVFSDLGKEMVIFEIRPITPLAYSTASSASPLSKIVSQS